MDDKRIVELYWQRDELAICKTSEKYEKYLTKIATNILENAYDAEESVNDTYLAAWNSIPPHRPATLKTYLSRLTRHISIDILRKKSSKKRGGEYAISLSELSSLTSPDSPEKSLDAKILSERINDFLKALPKKKRRAFIGRYYFLDSVKDIAKYCGMSEAAVKTLLFRLRDDLRQYLKKEGFDI